MEENKQTQNDFHTNLDIPFYKKENESAVKEARDVETKSPSLVEQIHEQAKYDIVKNDEQVQKSIVETAKKNIEVEMDTLSNKVEKENNKANMERNAEACSIFGYSSKKDIVEKWQQKMMVIVYNIWFVIYWFFASFTIAPIIFVFGKLQEGLKRTWLSITIAIIIYGLLALGIPFIISAVVKQGG